MLKQPRQVHWQRSEGGKAGGTKSRNPVEGPGEVAAKAGVCLLRELLVIRRGSSTARRATFARRGAPHGMTRERVFQQTATKARRRVPRVRTTSRRETSAARRVARATRSASVPHRRP